MNPFIVAAIPAFLLLMGIEAWVAKRRGLRVYRFGDTVADVGAGALHQLTNWSIALGGIFVYQLFFEWYPGVTWPGAWVWLVAFLGVDFCFYWQHRACHQVGFMWAAHVVHHQSEEYNLAVALRQSSLQPAFKWVFYWPLALSGVPLTVFLSVAAVNRLYQFCLHTRLIGRLGPLEWILNTPSHHRVHHGQNREYIDKNHGGMFIVWDRLFGTFESERAEVVYGVTEPVKSWNPVWANVDVWAALFRRATATRRLVDKVKLFVKHPSWRPDDVQEAAKAWPAPKYDPSAPSLLRRYVAGQFGLALTVTLVILVLPVEGALGTKIFLSVAVVLSLASLGALLDGRGWAAHVEPFRAPLLTIGAWMVMGEQLPVWALTLMGLWALSSVAWWGRISRMGEARQI